MTTYRGWHQIAYERDLHANITGMTVGSERLMLVRAGGSTRVFDAYCPHRGADLSASTVLHEGTITCPFHGRRIGLGKQGEDGFCAREYRSIVIGGLVFALFDEGQDRGFARYLASLDQTHQFVPGFSIHVRARPELVIENAFDHRHFRYVHGLQSVPTLKLEQDTEGQFCVFSEFFTGNSNPWQSPGVEGKGDQLGFCARVFSPNLCVTELNAGEYRPFVLTAATPVSTDTCVIRVSLALFPVDEGTTIDDASARQLLRDSKTSIEQDRRIWEGLSPRAVNNLVADDHLIERYQQFCAEFLDHGR